MSAVLERFYVNPREVRVGVRRHPDGWLATVTNRTTGRSSHAVWGNAQIAVSKALYEAKRDNMPGLDLEARGLYPHPWGGR